jgi:hypothetical protein
MYCKRRPATSMGTDDIPPELNAFAFSTVWCRRFGYVSCSAGAFRQRRSGPNGHAGSYGVHCCGDVSSLGNGPVTPLCIAI